MSRFFEVIQVPQGHNGQIRQPQDNRKLKKTPHEQTAERGVQQHRGVREKAKCGMHEAIKSELSCPGVTAGGARNMVVNRDD